MHRTTLKLCCSAQRLIHTHTHIYTHVYVPVINLTVTPETCPSVTGLSVFYPCLLSTNAIQSLGTQQAA